MESTNTPTTVENLTRIEYHGQLVLTTAQLADFYETSVDNIKVNYNRNVERFVEDKHFFRLEGDELRAFKHDVTNCYLVPPQLNLLYLWTKRGAARHAKMLNTDRAWDVFELLEDTYFDRTADKRKQIESNIENERQFLEKKRFALESDCFSLDMKNFLLKQDRFDLENEKLRIDRQRVDLEREKIYFERQCLDLGYKELKVRQEQLDIDREESAVRREELAARRERIDIDREESAVRRERIKTQRGKKPKRSTKDDAPPTLEIDPENEDLIRRAIKEQFDRIFTKGFR